MYDGKPESLSFIHNGKEITNTGTVNLTAGTTNEITLNLKTLSERSVLNTATSKS